MLEVPCTLRCDGCGDTRSITAKTVPTFIGGSVPGFTVFVVNDSALPEGWQIMLKKLHCPSCNGVK